MFYKIRVNYQDKTDYFCFNTGKKPFPDTSDDRRIILYTDKERAEGQADVLRVEYPDTTYTVIPHIERTFDDREYIQI